MSTAMEGIGIDIRPYGIGEGNRKDGARLMQIAMREASEMAQQFCNTHREAMAWMFKSEGIGCA
jgi:hypothetical protein